MPELPEVETMRRGIAHLVGSRIIRVDFPRSGVRRIQTSPRPEAIAAAVDGGRLARIERHGKRLALEIESSGPRRWLVIEPRMTGLLLVVTPPTTAHTRMVMRLRRGTGDRQTLSFWDQRGLGTIRLVDEHGLQRACGPERLGPDAMTITAEDLRRSLGRSRRAVKVALLDQRAVAGIGNIYAAEILHRAGIDPRVASRHVTRRGWDRIAAAARDVLAAATRCGGSSIGDELYQTPTRRPGRFQHRHRVYGRAGLPCPQCHGMIRRIVQGQRSTFFCPNCQTRRPREDSSSVC